MLGHQGVVNSAEFDRQGLRVVTASADGTARVWDAESGKPMTHSLVHDAEVYAAALSPDGRFVATGSWDFTAQIWDARTGSKTAPPMRHAHRVYCLAFSPDGKRLATGSMDRTVRIWDVATGEPLGGSLLHAKAVQVLSFHQGGRMVVATPLDSAGRVWDTLTGLPMFPPFHDRLIYSVFSPDGKRLATCGKDGSTRVWNVEPEGRPAELLLDLAHVLAGHRLDPSGNAIQIEPADVGRLWRGLEVKHPAEFEQTPENRRDWHIQRLDVARQVTRPFAVQFHSARTKP